MIFLRLFVVVLLAAVGYCALGFVFTRERRYLRFAWKLLVIGLIAAVIFLAVMFVQRLAGPVAAAPFDARSARAAMSPHQLGERLLEPRRVDRSG